MRHVRNIVTAACAAATLLGLSSCSASGDGPDRTPRASAPTGTTQRAEPSPDVDANPLPLPVQKYLLVPAEISAIKPATIILLNTCLQKRNVPPIKETTGKAGRRSDPDPYQVARRYGPIVKADVLTYGYHLAPTWLGDTTAPPKTSARQEAAMSGPSGCLAESQKELTGDHSMDSPAARQISGKSFAESLKDPKVKAVTADWSECMSKKGYSFTDPLQALSKADLSSAKPSAKELRTAAADYACKESTRLIRTWQEAETRIQDKEIAKQLSALEKANAQKARILAKADKIVARGG
ncbi:hypothetical protein [Streptomyces sp. NPDC058694]|uniref:hypothetical protein n=1 Tax=Streptomyces sp. NPDC058694 TaxID=3346603 RepID=UPI00365DA756